jgi:sugar porter (SP) family MFS transporter
MSKAEFATVSSIFTIGGLVGALCAGPFTTKRGRLPAMRITALFYIIGAVVETISGSIAIMAIGRLLTGVGAGAATVIVPLYISEVAPPRERGLFGAMTQVSINVGILITQTLGYFLSYGSAWRWILGAGIAIAVAQGLGLLAIPESPAWLAANGDVPKAKRILQRIRGKAFDIKDEADGWGAPGVEVAAEQEGLLSQEMDRAAPSSPTASKAQTPHLGFVQVVRDPLYRPAIIAVVGVMFAQQICGINSIIMYSVSLLNGLLPISSALITILISIVNLFITAACSPLPDRLGRKTCLLLSIVGQGSSSLVLALSIVFGVKILSAISVLAFVGFFAVGLGPVPFILASELVGQEAVGATQSWCLAANYTATFLVAQFFPIVNAALNDALGGAGWVYFIFAAMSVVSALFILWRVPETKGKKDADEVWGRTRRID